MNRFRAFLTLPCSRAPGRKNSIGEREEADSFLQVNDDGIAFLLADAFSEIRFDGQLMGTVSQSHERAAEGMAINSACNLDQATRAEELN